MGRKPVRLIHAIAYLFLGLALVSPGLVAASQSRPDARDEDSKKQMEAYYTLCLVTGDQRACGLIYGMFMLTMVYAFPRDDDGPNADGIGPEEQEMLNDLRSKNEALCQKSIPSSCAALVQYYGITELKYGGEIGKFEQFVEPSCVPEFTYGCAMAASVYMSRGLEQKSDQDMQAALFWSDRGCRYLNINSCDSAVDVLQRSHPERSEDIANYKARKCELQMPFDWSIALPDSCLEASRIYESGQGVAPDIGRAAALLRLRCDLSQPFIGGKTAYCSLLDAMVARRGHKATGISADELANIHLCRNKKQKACLQLARQYPAKIEPILPLPMHIRYYGYALALDESNEEARNALMRWCEKMLPLQPGETLQPDYDNDQCIKDLIAAFTVRNNPPMIPPPLPAEPPRRSDPASDNGAVIQPPVVLPPRRGKPQ